MIRLRRHCFLAVALFPTNASLEERIKILAPYLSPRPDQLLELSDATIRDKAVVTKKVETLAGTVRISPPPGACFTVTTDIGRPDVVVCKPTSLKWYLGDINRQTSTIVWSIKTSATDFGTIVTWKVPYLVAKTMPFNSDFFAMNSNAVFFKSCVPSLPKNDGTLRSLTLTLFDNSKWFIRFPDVDSVLAKTESPPPKPVEAPKKQDGGGHGEGHGEAKKEGAGHGEAKKEGAGHGEAKKEGAGHASKPVIEEPEPWVINTGRAYEMNVGNFISDGSMPPGRKGTCRYVYDYIPKDFSLGRIECHHTDQFLYFYMFLSCMQPIIPK
jgi:hypothetical protein